MRDRSFCHGQPGVLYEFRLTVVHITAILQPLGDGLGWEGSP
jgi:hypothetical protein